MRGNWIVGLFREGGQRKESMKRTNNEAVDTTLADFFPSWQHRAVKNLMVFAVVMAMTLFASAECAKKQAKTEAVLIDQEQRWAAALNRKDVEAVGCLLATEFEDVDVDGSLHTRKETLEKIPTKKPGTNQLSELRAHVSGNLGFTRGLATLTDASGKVVARVRFTDVFTYRDGRWQAMAGQESLMGEAHR